MTTSCRSPARSSRADRKSTRLNSSHLVISYAVFCLKKKKTLTRSFDASSADRCPSECSACPSQGQSNQLQSIRFYLSLSVLRTYSHFDPQRRNCPPNDRNDLAEPQHQRDLRLDRY